MSSNAGLDGPPCKHGSSGPLSHTGSNDLPPPSATQSGHHGGHPNQALHSPLASHPVYPGQAAPSGQAPAAPATANSVGPAPAGNGQLSPASTFLVPSLHQVISNAVLVIILVFLICDSTNHSYRQVASELTPTTVRLRPCLILVSVATPMLPCHETLL